MNNYKILVIENDAIAAANLQFSLENFGYKVVVMEKKFVAVKNRIKTFMPDLILVDVAYEDSLNYLMLTSFIHQVQIPFIILVAYSDHNMMEHIRNTEPCAYFIKPLNILNLHGTIQMSLYKFEKEKNLKSCLEILHEDNQNLKQLLYGKKIVNKPMVHIGDEFYFNVDMCETFYKNKRVELTKKENLFIQLLVANIGLIVDFQQAITHIWGNKKASENNVRTLVWRLRSKLKAETIKTSSGTGYYIEDSKALLTLAS